MYPVEVTSPVPRRVRAPSWLDLRLVAGVALVLASVLVGVKVVSSADRTTRVWAADRDLAAGTVLTPGDLRSIAVRLPSDGARYVTTRTDVIGQALNRPVAAGELVPASALEPAEPATTVTIPLGGDDAPRIAVGQRVTVWVSTKLCPSAVVLADVTVQGVQSAQGGAFDASGGEDVVVRVSPDLAERVVEALALDGGVLRAGILDGAASTAAPLPDLSSCAASGS